MGYPKKANLTEGDTCLVSVASNGARRVAVNYNTVTTTADSTPPTMVDASEPPPDFFASDGESEVGVITPAETVPSEPEPGSGIPSSQTSIEDPAADNPLFLPDEEDDDHSDAPVERLRSVSTRPDVNPADDVDMSEVFGIPQAGGSKPVPKRRPEEIFRPNKRRRLSPPPDPDFTSAFLGSIVVANAWSTVKGKGYVKNGDPILVEWDTLKQEDGLPGKGNKKRPLQKKGKQLTIAALVKPRQDKFKRKRQNDIVRLTDKGGFGELV